MIEISLGAIILTGIAVLGAGFWLGWISGFDAGVREVTDIAEERDTRDMLERRRARDE